jgi:hypothetical protein
MNIQPTVKKIDEIDDFTLPTDQPDIEESKALLNAATVIAVALVARQLPLTAIVSLAVSASIQTVTALLSTTSVKCHLKDPPADIEMKLDSTGKLIYRCFHSPAHEWDLVGNKQP